MPLNDDAVLHVAPKSGGDVVTELTEAFIVPKGNDGKTGCGSMASGSYARECRRTAESDCITGRNLHE